jgi:hypothetical protein
MNERSEAQAAQVRAQAQKVKRAGAERCLSFL